MATRSTLTLAERWEQEAKPPVEDAAAIATGSAQMVKKAERDAERETKRECADALRILVQLVGDNG